MYIYFMYEWLEIIFSVDFYTVCMAAMAFGRSSFRKTNGSDLILFSNGKFCVWLDVLMI